ncbi:mannosyl-oligosaccharide glucosidase [Aspergillus luchuensis]|uniref:Mannosyl-oligosaccharide glucosidase n=1 Tax=Aspergillus kawachii TaxID=1069201 RepID=A0A146FX36_ASPKA|nr:mannosyl-oligosaccharide glucosidase [Aspergillus luchuensis]
MAVSKSGGKKYGPVRKIEYRRRWRQSRNFDSKAHVKQDAQRWRGRSSAKTKKGFLWKKAFNPMASTTRKDIQSQPWRN